MFAVPSGDVVASGATSGAWLLGDARADTACRTEAQYAAAPDLLKTMGAGTLSADAGEAGNREDRGGFEEHVTGRESGSGGRRPYSHQRKQDGL